MKRRICLARPVFGGAVRKHLAALCLFAVFFSCFWTSAAWAKPAWPGDTGILAEAGIVIDADTGAVLYGQNIHNPYPPASITKLLTALVVLENSDISGTVPYTENALYSIEAGSGNKLSLRVGDTLSVEDSLYGLLLVSSNQCANALAEYTAGSLSAFVDLMNGKVAQLGLTESHFDNPSGLNGETQYVTAYDMAMIARAAFANEELLKISSSLSHRIGGTQLFPDGQSLSNEHRLLYTTDPASEFYCPEAVAGKTGYLLAAGNTLVTFGEADGRHVISVILKGKPRQYFLDGKTLLQFGLQRFRNVSIAENETRYGTGSGELKLNGATYRQDELSIGEGSMITIPNGADFADVDVALEEQLPETAPVGAAGELVYYYQDRRVGSAYLMTEGTPVAVGIATPGNPEGGARKQAGGRLTIPSFRLPRISFPQADPFLALAVLFGLLAAAFLAGGAAWLIRSRKREKEELAARRERRRKRLSEEGGTARQAEFDRIKEERWGKNKKTG